MAEDVTDIYREFGDSRVPPGQRETDEFPVLSKGETPSWTEETWSFDVWGAVESELSLSYDEFRDLPSTTQTQDFHCVTGWSTLDTAFTGVPFATVAERAGVDDDAVHVLFHALDGYTTDLPLSDCASTRASCSRTATTVTIWRPTTAGRSGSSPRTSTRTRARSGSTAWSS